ncbi:MAG TPA: response regulator [Flavobacteriia bacterium]|nr:response regulator [Flavobacteriia bacterium]
MNQAKKIVFCITLTLLLFFKSIGQNNIVDNYTVKNGLSSNWVSCFQLDEQGYLWIGTQNGLNRFDGKTFKKYYSLPFEKGGLASNWVRIIKKDDNGFLWLGTVGGGLQRLHPVSEKFDQSFKINGEIPKIIKSINIINNSLLVATDKGLLLAEKPYESFNYLNKYYFEQIISLGNNYAILISKKKSYLYNLRTKKLKKIELNGELSINKTDAKLNYFYALYKNNITKYHIENDTIKIIQKHKLNVEKSNTTLWGSKKLYAFNNNFLLSSKKGIKFYNFKQNEIASFLNFNPETENTILSYFSTKNGSLWIGTKKGIFYLDKNSNTYKNANNGWQFIPQKGIREIYLDNNYLWIANKDGLVRYAKNGSSKKIVSGNITALRFYKNYLYVAGRNNKKQNYFWQINLKSNQKKGFSLSAYGTNGRIWKILPFKDKIFIGGSYNFLLFNTEDITLKSLKNKSNSQFSSTVIADMLVYKKDIWIATMEGLYILKNGDLNHIKNIQANKKNGLTNNIVFDLHNYKDTLYLATENGLHRYNNNNGTFKNWNVKNGLTDPKLLTIESDNLGNLWLGTNSKGLFKFNIKTETFTNFNKKYGLSSDEFLLSSSFSKGNQLFFGTENKIVTFNAKNLNLLKENNNPLIVESIFSDNENEKFKFDLNKKIVLPYNYGNLNIKFTLPNCFNPEETNYSYKINGLYKSWINIDNNNSFSLVNMPPGHYNLELKANNQLFKPNKKNIEIVVKKPFYNTFLAWLIYFILLTGLIYYFYIEFKSRIIATNKINNLKEINKVKSKLYAEISHEIKTPLTLIKGNTSILAKKEITEEQKKAINAIKRSSKELLSLVNQMLDLAAIDVKKFELNYATKDVVLFLKQCISLFESRAANHKKKLLFKSETESLISSIDVQNLKKVIFNLISNALKFTPQNGTITLELLIPNSSSFIIKVSDTGKGIEPEHLPKIFDRYYKTFDLANNLGSGIGMSLSKEIIQLMDGKITVDSIVNQGTTFTITLPVQQSESSINPENDTGLSQPNSKVTLNKEFYLVVVDDNESLLDYYRDILNETYHVTYFKNGERALQYVKKNRCDFILSDAIMPIMDGFELCKELRKDWTTSHIPFIMVSALSNLENKKEGYKLGIDAYLEKPFEEQELLAVIQNLLNKQKLRARYFKKYFNVEKEVNALLAPKDLDFIEKLHNIVFNKDKIINIESLAQELGLSRSQLHRKIRMLTEMSTTEYINHIRIEKAKQLLLHTRLDINEIAYQIGYSDSGYFIKIFKKKLNSTPKNWREMQQKPTSDSK